MTHALSALFLAKLTDQVERLEHLLDLIPPDKLAWRPPVPSQAFALNQVLGHLLECLAGVCATLYAVYPKELAHFTHLRALPVNHPCPIDEARQRMREYMRHIGEGFRLLSDRDLARHIPTVFVPGGEAVLTVLLGNLEHLINHKHQLFFYLKLLGVPVTTRDLYQWRGESGTGGV
jgi:DinB family protein